LIPFRIFMTGDLSFFSMILGKASSATSCYLCNSTSNKWKPHGHEKATAWTLDRLLQTNQLITNRNKVVEGVKRLPLLTTVEIDRFLPPTMHIMLGIGNNILDDCLKFLDALNGLDNVPDNVRLARQNFYDLLTIEMDVKQEMEVWVDYWGPELIQLRESRSDVIQLINGDRTHRSLSRRQLQLAREDREYCTTMINQLVKDRKEIEKRLQQASQDVAKAKKIMRECEGTVPTTSKWLRMEIEQNFLEPFGVTRVAYHGGDLVGPSVKSLMANADDIFSTLEAFLLDVAEENGILIEDEIEQVRARLQVYRLVLKNFDGLFSLLRDKESQLNINEKMEQLAKFLDAAMLCWCRLNISITPKLHIVEDHLLDVIAHIETLQYFDEEFVERAHQKGLKYN